MSRVPFLLLFLCLTVDPGAALAQEAVSGAAGTDGFVTAIVNETRALGQRFESVALNIFFGLLTINFVFLTSKALFGGGALSDLFGPMLRMIAFAGIFIAIINFGDRIAGFILENASGAARIGADNPTASPGEVFETFQGIAIGVATSGSIFSFGSAANLIAGPFLAVVIFIAGIGITATIVIAIIEVHIAAGVGVIALGFAGWDETQDIARAYLRWVVGMILKLMSIYIIAGVMQNIADAWFGEEVATLSDTFSIMGLSVIMFMIVRSVPSTLQQIVSGAGFNTSSEAGLAAAKLGAIVATYGAVKGGAWALNKFGGDGGGGVGGLADLGKAAAGGGSSANLTKASAALTQAMKGALNNDDRK